MKASFLQGLSSLASLAPTGPPPVPGFASLSPKRPSLKVHHVRIAGRHAMLPWGIVLRETPTPRDRRSRSDDDPGVVCRTRKPGPRPKDSYSYILLLRTVTQKARRTSKNLQVVQLAISSTEGREVTRVIHLACGCSPTLRALTMLFCDIDTGHMPTQTSALADSHSSATVIT